MSDILIPHGTVRNQSHKNLLRKWIVGGLRSNCCSSHHCSAREKQCRTTIVWQRRQPTPKSNGDMVVSCCRVCPSRQPIAACRRRNVSCTSSSFSTFSSSRPLFSCGKRVYNAYSAPPQSPNSYFSKGSATGITSKKKRRRRRRWRKAEVEMECDPELRLSLCTGEDGYRNYRSDSSKLSRYCVRSIPLIPSARTGLCFLS